MNDQHPVFSKITDLNASLGQNKNDALTALLDSDHREAYKTHIQTLIDDLKWIVERMGDDAP